MLEVAYSDEDVDVCEAIRLQVLKALLGMGDEGAEEGGFQELGKGGEGHFGGTVEFYLEDHIGFFLQVSCSHNDDSALERPSRLSWVATIVPGTCQSSWE